MGAWATQLSDLPERPTTVARELLAPTGSIFVQISDENLHHVREVLDEVFGSENFISQSSRQKTTGLRATSLLHSVSDYILWYAQRKKSLEIPPST